MDKELLEALQNYRDAANNVIMALADAHYLTGKSARPVKAFVKADVNLSFALKKAIEKPAAVPAPQPAPAPTL